MLENVKKVAALFGVHLPEKKIIQSSESAHCFLTEATEDEEENEAADKDENASNKPAPESIEIEVDFPVIFPTSKFDLSEDSQELQNVVGDDDQDMNDQDEDPGTLQTFDVNPEGLIVESPMKENVTNSSF